MRKRHTSIKTLSPLLKHAKILFLILSGLLLLANLYVLSQTRQHAQSYTEQQNQATWFLFQLTKEFSELNVISKFAAHGDEHLNKTQLKYDLTWSRFDLLITNREADTFIALPGAKSFFVGLFEDFKALEGRLQSIQSEQQAKQFSDEIDQLYMSMIQYVNTNFRVQSPLYQSQMEQARNLNVVQFALLILLLICGGLAAIILHKESEFHKVQSLTDSLTGIANRLAMFQVLKDFALSNTPFTLYLLDLNGFKIINDKYGHQAGDKVLKTFSARLTKIHSSCFRIGGDEFAILVKNKPGHISSTLINEVRIMMAEPIEITLHDSSNTEIIAATSIGFAQYPQDSKDINELLLIADGQMYREKHSFRKRGSIDKLAN